MYKALDVTHVCILQLFVVTSYFTSAKWALVQELITYDYICICLSASCDNKLIIFYNNYMVN